MLETKKWKISPITDGEVCSALSIAATQVRRNLPEFTYSSQNHSSVDGFYPPCENDQWTCGFWPGVLWISYEYTNYPVFQYAAMIQVESFLHRIQDHIEVGHHDMGFLYTPSCVAAYKLTGDKRAKEAAMLAADQLISRFQPKGEFIQAWGEMNAKGNYRYIIDCLMNLPLLYWATEVTRDEKYRDIALRHTATCLKYSIRTDGSTCHTFFMDQKTGEPLCGVTCQGYRDDSVWARGQAWAVYGTALAYRYTKNPECLKKFQKVTNLYLSRLPEDMVPYWDMTFTSGMSEPRDSSSASIAACGLLEVSALVPARESLECIILARRMLKSLVDSYSTRDFSKSNGLVLHGTYSKKSPYNTCTQEGVDECVSWGDYFYMEALIRLNRKWNPYW